MKLYDVSMPIEESMVVYKNNPNKRPQLTITRDFDQGARETRLSLDMHTGTHVDAPLHFVPEGKTIDQIPLDRLLRSCRVLDLTSVRGGIEVQDLQPWSIKGGEFIILKTRNSLQTRREFDPEFVYVTGEAAEYLVNVGIDGVGIDALGIERSQPDHRTHRLLLSHGILIIEGLQLAEVPPGEYMMSALPLAVPGAEAAPARVVLWTD